MIGKKYRCNTCGTIFNGILPFFQNNTREMCLCGSTNTQPIKEKKEEEQKNG